MELQSCPGRARVRESGDPGPHGKVRYNVALRESCAGSRVSIRSAKRPRSRRPGHAGLAPSPRMKSWKL